MTGYYLKDANGSFLSEGLSFSGGRSFLVGQSWTVILVKALMDAHFWQDAKKFCQYFGQIFLNFNFFL
jgi:hypothetical protein